MTQPAYSFAEVDLVASFCEATRLAGASLQVSDVRAEVLPAPHRRPSTLPTGSQAVYAFFLADHCLKVGKAGPKTIARFTSQHYGLNAPSTLAKSILKNGIVLRPMLPDDRHRELETLDELNVGPWIEKNTTRLNVFLPTRTGELLLSLLEAFLQVRFKPVFEGRSAGYTDI